MESHGDIGPIGDSLTEFGGPIISSYLAEHTECHMLIDEASEALNERAIAGATLATTNEDWKLCFASEVGLLILVIIWLVSVVTKPFRRIREIPENPFEPYDGTVYIAVTDSRVAFFEVKHSWFTTELGNVLAEHHRSEDLSIGRSGQMVNLQFGADLQYSLFWMDSQYAWQSIATKLNCERDVDAQPNAK